MESVANKKDIQSLRHDVIKLQFENQCLKKQLEEKSNEISMLRKEVSDHTESIALLNNQIQKMNESSSNIAGALERVQPYAGDDRNHLGNVMLAIQSDLYTKVHLVKAIHPEVKYKNIDEDMAMHCEEERQEAKQR